MGAAATARQQRRSSLHRPGPSGRWSHPEDPRRRAKTDCFRRSRDCSEDHWMCHDTICNEPSERRILSRQRIPRRRGRFDARGDCGAPSRRCTNLPQRLRSVSRGAAKKRCQVAAIAKASVTWGPSKVTPGVRRPTGCRRAVNVEKVIVRSDPGRHPGRFLRQHDFRAHTCGGGVTHAWRRGTNPLCRPSLVRLRLGPHKTGGLHPLLIHLDGHSGILNGPARVDQVGWLIAMRSYAESDKKIPQNILRSFMISLNRIGPTISKNRLRMLNFEAACEPTA